MDTSRMTVKGQVTIPKSIRERLELHPGDAVEFGEEPRGFVSKSLWADLHLPVTGDI